ncbi:uncharacterized protein LOC109815455 [Cajanus cajan]|uniref:uncharacterized protein LOC109815455 n=1 Tax=Cajanus cajan TaxID=3821 RepID=UPI00098DCBF5|nr:uncharacterized protein LOC109815455 [Cajanus cajan]
MLMENLLRYREYWQVVVDGVATPKDGMTLIDAQQKEFDAMKLKDLKGKNYLFQAIDCSILETIFCKDTSRDICDSMKKKYQGSSRFKCSHLQALRRDFEVLQMKKGESVTSYCSRTFGVANNKQFHDEKMDDTTIVEKILHSLTLKFDYVVCSIEESNDIDNLSIDELQSSLLVHEQKMNICSTMEEKALKASTNTHSNNSRGRGRGKGRGRGSRGNKDFNKNSKGNNDQFQGKDRGRDLEKSKIECFRCHKLGHYASEFYTRLLNHKEKRKSSNFVEEKEVETLLMVVEDAKDNEAEIWYVDIDCSSHISENKSPFSYLNENFHSIVGFGDC